MGNNNIIIFTYSAGILALSIVLLVLGREIIMPLAISIVIWYLINALTKLFSRIRVYNFYLPRWLCLLVSLILIIFLLIAFGNLISKNISEVIKAAPSYQENLNNLFYRVSNFLGLTKVLSIRQILDQFDFRSLISKFATGATSIAANAGIIIIYVLFLLAEQQTFQKKLVALFPEKKQQTEIKLLLNKIQNQIQTYVWIKTLMSTLTGGVCYIILTLIGLDFAVFWAFVIFLLNYLPTIGSLLAIILPSTLALVQFDSTIQFFILIVTLGVTQFMIGNVIEPKLMGRSLNLSPLVVIITLVVWSSIWGIVGALLCVPITVILMIIFSQFDRTKKIAILLSGDGKIN